MKLRRYFEDEMNELTRAGAAFAKEFPDIAHWLGHPGSDPAVERWLEGSAFLAARVRQRIDEQLPLLAQRVCAVVAPRLLEPIPALSLLQFYPSDAGMRHPTLVSKGSEVGSVEVEGTSCRFQTTSNVTVQPLEIHQVTTKHEGATSTSVRIGIRAVGGMTLAQLELKDLRFHLLGDWSCACALYGALLGGLAEVRCEWRIGVSSYRANLANTAVRPVGLGETDQGLLEPDGNAFDPFQCLTEYEVFPRQFLAFDIDLAPLRSRFGSADQLDIVLTVDRPLHGAEEPGADSFGLFCTPVINLFECASEPIVVRHEQDAYHCRPAGYLGGQVGVHSLLRVHGQDSSSGEQFEIPPLFGYAKSALNDPPGRHYYLAERRSIHQASEVWLSFSIPSWVHTGSKAEGSAIGMGPEVVSADLLCTNDQLPSRLTVGDICIATGNTPPLVKFRNLTVPTPLVEPPIGESLYWQVLSYLQLNHACLATLDQLKELLMLRTQLYRVDAQAEALLRARLGAIGKWKKSHHDHAVEGLPIRCTQFELTADAAPFGGEGGLLLFGAVLYRTLRSQAPLNTTCCLRVCTRARGQVGAFEPSGEIR